MLTGNSLHRFSAIGANEKHLFPDVVARILGHEKSMTRILLMFVLMIKKIRGNSVSSTQDIFTYVQEIESNLNQV